MLGAHSRVSPNCSVRVDCRKENVSRHQAIAKLIGFERDRLQPSRSEPPKSAGLQPLLDVHGSTSNVFIATVHWFEFGANLSGARFKAEVFLQACKAKIRYRAETEPSRTVCCTNSI